MLKNGIKIEPKDTVTLKHKDGSFFGVEEVLKEKERIIVTNLVGLRISVKLSDIERVFKYDKNSEIDNNDDFYNDLGKE